MKKIFLTLIIFCLIFKNVSGQKFRIKTEFDTKADTNSNLVTRVLPNDDYNIKTSFSQLINGKVDNNFWIDIDKDKQILNLSIAQWNYKKLIGNFKGSISNVNTPLFSNNWNPRDWSISPNINWLFKDKRFYALYYDKDTCIKNSICNKLVCIDLDINTVYKTFTTFERFHWINLNPKYNRNTYDYIPRIDSVTITSRSQTVGNLDLNVSYNYYARWSNLGRWTPRIIRFRPDFFYFALGYEYKIQNNINDLVEWNIETERSYNDITKGEIRKKKENFTAYYGNFSYQRISQLYTNISIGFAGNLVFDFKHKQSIQETTFSNRESQFTLGGKFNNSEGEVKSVVGLYVKYVNNSLPVFGITTKLPF